MIGYQPSVQTFHGRYLLSPLSSPVVDISISCHFKGQKTEYLTKFPPPSTVSRLIQSVLLCPTLVDAS